jgi:hypothetical protein
VPVLQFGDRERAIIAAIGFRTTSQATAQAVTGSFGKRYEARGQRRSSFLANGGFIQIVRSQCDTAQAPAAQSHRRDGFTVDLSQPKLM